MKQIITIIFLLVLFSVNAQNSNKIFLEIDLQEKFTIGNNSYKTLYGELISGRVQKQLTYPYPVNQLTLAINYQLNKSLNFGIASGINVSKQVNVPGGGYIYYDKVKFPLYGKFEYSIVSNDNWNFNSSLIAGYQFSATYLRYFYDRWSQVEYGGFMTGLDFKILRKYKKYNPYLRLGYEYNRFLNHKSFGWYSDTESHIEDFAYYSFCHLVKIGLGIKI